MSSIRLLPLLVIVASFAFAVRIGEVYTGAREISGGAFAQQKEETKKADEKSAEKTNEKAAEKAADVKQPQPVESGAAAPPSSDSLAKPGDAAAAKATPDVELPKGEMADDATEWKDASESDIDYSNVRKEVYQDLMRRRQDLDDRDKELAKREALIKAAENELDRKYQELTGIRNEIQGLLKKQSAEEEARIASLVKIYEGMKAKDAARIFNTLDMDVLLEVVSKMSERKSAPIIAEMDDNRARSLTLFLAEQKKLPSVPETGAPAAAAK